MSERNASESADDTTSGENLFMTHVLRPLWRYRSVIVSGTLLAGLLAAAGGWLYYLLQTPSWSGSIEFRLMFQNAAINQYPNGTPFSTRDINERTLVDRVYDLNHIESFCGRDDFRQSFSVRKGSSQLRFLDADYGERLRDARVSAVDRQRFAEEYQVKRGQLPAQYRLTFERSAACALLPPFIAQKALNDLLQVWADEVVVKRGVIELEIGVLSPAIFDLGSAAGESLVVRCDLIRSTLLQAFMNARRIKMLPGTTTVRAGKERVSIQEIVVRLNDLANFMLDPLLTVAGRGLGLESAAWLDEALKGSLASAKAADEKRQVFAAALRAYSATNRVDPNAKTDATAQAGQVQTLLDASFIDHVVVLAARDLTYRQKLTDRMIQASLEAADASSAAERYRQSRGSLQPGLASPATLQMIERQLLRVIEDGKRAVGQLGTFYEEFLATSPKADASLYRIVQPAIGYTRYAFAFQTLLFLIVGTVLAAAFVLSVLSLVHYHVRAMNTGIRVPTPQT